MPTDPLVLLLIVPIAAAAAYAVLRRTAKREAEGGVRPSKAHRPGILAGMADIVDVSIGMLMLRRLLRRPTRTRADGRAEQARWALVATAEDARRAAGGPALVAPTRLVGAGTAATHAPRDLPDRQTHPVAGAPAVLVTPRWRVTREGALAAAGLMAVLVAGFGLWSRNEGSVLSATGAPAPPGAAAPAAAVSESPIVSSSPTATDDLTALETLSPSPTPRPTAVPTATPASATARPTAPLTPRPAATRTPQPTNTPKPTAHATPKPTATPAPTDTAPPAPPSTATPPPTPPPTATPSPTPDPTT